MPRSRSRPLPARSERLGDGSRPEPALPAPAPFEGFRTGTRPVTLPAELFVELLPTIEDETELRVTLHALFAIARVHGSVRAVRQSELARDTALMRGLAHCGGPDSLAGALDAAVARGTLLGCPLEQGDTLYLVNNEGGRRLHTRIVSGAQALPNGERPVVVDVPVPTAPAAVYQQEIGTLTPGVASLLAEAEGLYTAEWVVDALRLAAANNARSWRYAEAILRRWESEGRTDEATRGDARTADPYGHVYRRE